MTEIQLPALDEFVSLDSMFADVESTFSTLDSLRWFVRRNRDDLVRRGALIIVAGRMRFHPALFQRATVEIGQKAAA